MTKAIVLIHLAATAAMVGVIWFVQIVHYPLFDRVGAGGFSAYEAAHRRLTGFVVAPLMLVELATAFAVLWRAFASEDARPAHAALAVVGALLVGLVWATTFFVSVPQHEVLSREYDARAHATLVATNWIRTVAWTARGAIALWLAAGA